MAHSNKLPLALMALALVVIVAGVFAPLRAPRPVPVPAAANGGSEIFERVLFGTSFDDGHLVIGAPPVLVHRVPAGLQLLITDVDATAGGLVLLRRSQQQVEQVGLLSDDGSVGFGQASRSYTTGIPFGPGEELLVQANGGDVEWAILRGVVSPVGAPDSGP
jgi:hypothetical protein